MTDELTTDAYDDLDTIADKSKRALTALACDDIETAQDIVQDIRDTAAVWDGRPRMTQFEFTDGYDSIEDIAKAVISRAADSRGVDQDELETVPVEAIDEVEMDKALQNPDDLSQHEWDTLRAQISAEIAYLGVNVD